MKLFFVASAVFQFLLLAALYLVGRKHVLAGLKHPYDGPQKPASAPKVALIVPITGDTPAVRAGLTSLLDQDYPDLQVVFVTCDEADPATALVRSMLAGRPFAAHLLSGRARACGQKNHNHLAGVAHVGGQADIFVFCDSTHVARPDLVRLLVQPLADGRAVMSGGFHRVVPLDYSLGALGILCVCVALHCMQAVKAITQPWGGAMAVTRKAFEEHGVAEVWAHNIVDDFSMGPHLAKKGIRCFAVSPACLDTPLRDVPTRLWLDWYTRQLLYLKFCTPGMWLGGIVPIWLFGGPPLMAGLALLAWLIGAASGWWLMAVLVYLTIFTGLGMLFRTFSPRPMPLWAWMKGFTGTMLASLWCYLRTWTTFTMSWRGISYRVTWGGRVVEVLES